MARARWRCGLLLAVAAAWVPIPASDAGGGVTQLTSTAEGCSYLSPQLSGDGRWLVAIAVCPPGPTRSQDHRLVRIERTSGQEQLVTPPGADSFSPSVSGDGRRLVFISNADLPFGENPHHLDQVFLFDADTHLYTQVTRIRSTDANRTVMFPRISEDGATVVFASDADLVSGQNQDGNLELFLFDVKGGQLQQITKTEPPARHERPVISRDGQTVAFVGLHPPLGPRFRTGLYLWSRAAGAVRRLIETPAADAGAFAQLVLAGGGTRLVFSGRFDLVGENPDRNIELFTFDVATGLPRQLTYTRGCASANPALSTDGSRLVFASNCRFDRLNPDRETNVFLLRMETGEVVQLTDSGTIAVVESPTLDRAARLAAVAIGAELEGMTNPNRLLQVALLELPALPPAAATPVRLVTAQDVTMVLVSRHEPDTLYLSGRGTGVMKSEDNGRSWRLFSYALGTETVTTLVEHPDRRGLLFAGTPDAGIYKILNNTGVWVSASHGLPDQRILGLAIDPVYSDVLYADTPTGLFRSLDLGDNWARVDARVAPRPDGQGQISPVSVTDGTSTGPNANTLVPVAGAAGRLLRLTKDGLLLLSGEDSEWVPVKTPLPPDWVLVGPRGRPWFVGTSQGVFRADHPDKGWSAVPDLPVGLLPPLVLSTGGIVRTAAENGDLELSRDGGRTWAPLRIPAPSPQGLESVLFRMTQ